MILEYTKQCNLRLKYDVFDETKHHNKPSCSCEQVDTAVDGNLM